MGHNHPLPGTDPAGLSDSLPPMGSAPDPTGAALPTTGDTDTNARATGTDNPIIPPSADIIPASPLPPNSNTTNNPVNQINNQSNQTTTSPDNSPTDPSQNHNNLNNGAILGSNNGANNNEAGKITDQKQNNSGTAPPPPPPPPPTTTTTIANTTTAATDNSNNHVNNNSTLNNPISSNKTVSTLPTNNFISSTSNNTATTPTTTLPTTNDVTSAAGQANTQQHSTDSTSPIQSTPRQSQAQFHHTQQNTQSGSNNSNTGSSLGTIMGILVAAVIGAIILAGVLAMIKRRKKARDQADYHPDFFNNEKPYPHDSNRQSLESGQGGLPMSPLKSRADGLYGPRPPTIIERHQASAAIPGPMPSYQPGQIFNYANSSQHFNLHRPKPPTYHSPYGDQASEMAYANHPPIDPAPSTGAGQINQSYHDHNISYDHSQIGIPEKYGGMNMMVPNPAPYPPIMRGEQYPNYQVNNQPMAAHSSPAATYNQQQVDQLDFFGHPSPAATMIGSVPADWNSRKLCEKPFNVDNDFTGADVAAGIALTDDQTGTKPPLPMVSNLQQSYLDYHDPSSQDVDHEKRTLNDLVEGIKSHDYLQQSYLDCNDRASQDAQVNKNEGLHERIEMDNLNTTHKANTTDGTTVDGSGGFSWKLASPKLSSPLGDFFGEGMIAPDHPPIDPAPLEHDAGPHDILYNERIKHSLKVMNH